MLMSLPMVEEAVRIRLDKWLWAARLFKTRALAAEEVGKGHVLINQQPAKASREVRVGDVIRFRRGKCHSKLSSGA